MHITFVDAKTGFTASCIKFKGSRKAAAQYVADFNAGKVERMATAGRQYAVAGAYPARTFIGKA